MYILAKGPLSFTPLIALAFIAYFIFYLLFIGIIKSSLYIIYN